MPDTHSIGLGGGSRVRKLNDNTVTVGPDSVGYRLTKEALCFGGDIVTATDVAVFSGFLEISKNPDLEEDLVLKAQNTIQTMVEEIIDIVKTSEEEVPVVLVGGGAILIDPNAKLAGSSKTIRPPNAEVANAIGSALCQVSGRIDIMAAIDPNIPNAAEKALEELKSSAIDAAVANGAVRNSVELVEVEFVPISYLPGNAIRIKIVSVGDLDFQSNLEEINIVWDKFPEQLDILVENEEEYEETRVTCYQHSKDLMHEEQFHDNLKKEIWQLTENDVEKASIGAAILGCAGGGNPYLGKLRTLDLIKNECGIIKIISIDRLLKESATSLKNCAQYVIPIGFMGAPTVYTEKPSGKIEVRTALEALRAFINGKFHSTEFTTDGSGVEYLRLKEIKFESEYQKPFLAVMPYEIGGLNSTKPWAIAADLGCYCLDADLMGRAFPEMQVSGFLRTMKFHSTAQRPSNAGAIFVLFLKMDGTWAPPSA
uniref:Hydantoinase A/oxoprolinase domain-containing protein n=1 Tax=Acrobeloides nanus TaxID=290746 RepID=A0A914E2H7_9BILA